MPSDVADEADSKTAAAQVLGTIGFMVCSGLYVLMMYEADQWRYSAALEPTISALSEGLRDADPIVRNAAASALVDLGSDGVPILAKALADPSAAVRGLAAQSLGKMGGEATPAIPELQTLLKEKDTEVRASVFMALGKIQRR